MKSPCESDRCCETESECCDSPAACPGGGDKCPVTGASSGCPVEGLSQVWAQSFGCAMKEAQTEILKAKILKAWGPMMEQTADALLATMGAQWAAMGAQVKAAEAKQAFKQQLQGMMTQGGK